MKLLKHVGVIALEWACLYFALIKHNQFAINLVGPYVWFVTICGFLGMFTKTEASAHPLPMPLRVINGVAQAVFLCGFAWVNVAFAALIGDIITWSNLPVKKRTVKAPIAWSRKSSTPPR